MSQPFNVAVCIDTRDGAGRRRLYGVAQYAWQHNWRMMLVRHRDAKGAAEVVRLRPHGVLTYITDATLIRAVKQLDAPLVDTAMSEIPVPMCVSLDNAEVARLATEALSRLGLTHFGYCGVDGKIASIERRDAFAEHLQSYGFGLSSFSQNIAEGESRMKPLIKWLRALPKPVGVLTFDDKLAERVLAACRWSELAVPGEVAVLGIGNDDLVSKLTQPPLSSINVPAEKIGYEAAAMLDQAMRGQRIKRTHVLILPTGVTMRGSTELLSVRDPLVEAAALYIREHAGDRIGAEHIARAFGVSRRTLDRRFMHALGRSAYDDLIVVRMQKASLLLSESPESIAQIAKACGFRTAASFSRAFHRQMGSWPNDYRHQVRG